MTAKEIAGLICTALEEKKAEDIKVLNIEEISIMADYFIIASGTNQNQVHALVDSVELLLKKNDIYPKQVEGYKNANWVLLDYGDVIVHVFDEENRLFYDLERIWRDGKNVSVENLK